MNKQAGLLSPIGEVDDDRLETIETNALVSLLTEDHRLDLKTLALDPIDGNVAAYLHADDFQETLIDTLHKIVFGDRATELNSIAFARLRHEGEAT